MVIVLKKKKMDWVSESSYVLKYFYKQTHKIVRTQEIVFSDYSETKSGNISLNDII